MMASDTMPTRPPRPVPLPRTWSVGRAEIVAVLVANGVLILAMWVRHGGLEQLVDARRPAHRDRPADGAVRDLPRAHPARPDVAQPVARPGLRDGRPRRRPSLARVRDCVWLLLGHGIFTTTGYALGDGSNVVGEFVTLDHDLSVRADGARQWRAVRDGRDQLDPGRAPAAVVRDVVRPPPVRLSRDRARVPPPALRRGGLHPRPDRRRLLGRALRRDRRPRARLPHRPAGLAVRPPPAARRPVVHEAPGIFSIYLAGRDLDQLAVRSGQYFVWRFLTRDGWWRAHPFSISSAPNGAVAADHHQGARRLVDRAAPRPDRDAGLHRGSVRHPDRRPPDPATRCCSSPAGSASRRSGRCSRHSPAGPATSSCSTACAHASRHRLPRRARRRSPASAARAIHYVVGSRDAPGGRSARRRRARSASSRTSLDRDVYLCGPVSMMDGVEATLHDVGLPDNQIHTERFAY